TRPFSASSAVWSPPAVSWAASSPSGVRSAVHAALASTRPTRTIAALFLVDMVVPLVRRSRLCLRPRRRRGRGVSGGSVPGARPPLLCAETYRAGGACARVAAGERGRSGAAARPGAWGWRAGVRVSGVAGGVPDVGARGVVTRGAALDPDRRPGEQGGDRADRHEHR